MTFGEKRSARSVFEKRHGHRLTMVAQAAVAASVSATWASCSQSRTRRRRPMSEAEARSTHPDAADRDEAFPARHGSADFEGDAGLVVRPLDRRPGMSAIGEHALGGAEFCGAKEKGVRGSLALRSAADVFFVPQRRSGGDGGRTCRVGEKT
jgi:hypothetical protein